MFLLIFMKQQVFTLLLYLGLCVIPSDLHTSTYTHLQAETKNGGSKHSSALEPHTEAPVCGSRSLPEETFIQLGFACWGSPGSPLFIPSSCLWLPALTQSLFVSLSHRRDAVGRRCACCAPLGVQPALSQP